MVDVMRAFYVCIVSLLYLNAKANSLPPPEYAASPAQHRRAVVAVEGYIQSIAADVDARPGAHPLYQFHPPGVKTRGVVVLWHGGFGVPENMGFLGRYLFENAFNVFLPPIAGHALMGNRWPYTLLRDEMGGGRAKRVLMEDAEIMRLVKGIENGTVGTPVHEPDGFDMDMMLEKVLRLFKEELSAEDNKNVLAAFNLLTRDDSYPDLEKDLMRYFETNHYQYDSAAYNQLSLVSSLPGPVHAGGQSMGGLTTLFAAARSKRVERAVVMAPFFESAAPPGKPSYRYLLEAAGVLDLYNAPFGDGVFVPSRILPAADTAGRMAMQDEVTRNVREHTATFCLFAEDDGMSDYAIGIRICRDALRNDKSIAYSYPAEDGVDHSVAPGSPNKYSTAVAKEILRFFATGKVNTDQLRTKEGDNSMPDVPALDAPFNVTEGDGGVEMNGDEEMGDMEGGMHSGR